MADDLNQRTEALERFLAEAAGSAGATLERAQPLSGGAIQENWRIDVRFADGPYAGSHTLVLRRDAPSAVAVSLSRAQEVQVLRAAWQAGVTVPEPLWSCSDPAVLGRPFYVMRRVDGVALGSKVVKDTRLAPDRAALGGRLGRELARIHSIRPPRDDLAFLEMPAGNVVQHWVARYRDYLDVLAARRPTLEWGLRWCERHAPVSRARTLVHQDFRTGNFVVDETGLVAVLDWEFAAWGDPMSDLGWLCARCWRFGRDDLEAGGVAARADLYRGYEAESDAAVDDSAVRFWEVMAHLRWAVIALQQGERHLSGAQPSLELALTGRKVPELELDILRATAPTAWEFRNA